MPTSLRNSSQDNLQLHTSDPTAANVERIAELFPNCVTEAADEKGKIERAIDFW